MAIFACSFDAASPLAGWTTIIGGTSIVAGRNGNGCSINGALRKNFSGGSVACASFARKMIGGNLGQAGDLRLRDLSGVGFNGADIRLSHDLADGRLRIYLTTDFASDRFVLDSYSNHADTWFFSDLVATIVQNSVPLDGTHSTVTIGLLASAYVNNQLIGMTSNSHSGVLLNSQIPFGLFTEYSVEGNCLVDDCFVDGTRLGDAKVQSDDTTITVGASSPLLTQTLFEVGIQYASKPILTQTLFEVGKQFLMGGQLIYEA